jgi:F-type H+-transporting ATPase subunit b
MNIIVLFAQAENGGQIEQIARTFGVNWPHLIAQIISFSIVCGLLYLFAYKPVLRMLTERQKLIAQGLANSEKIRVELEKTETQRKDVIAQANTQANQFIEDARSVAAQLREQETKKAISAAEQIMVKAREAAAQDHTRMLAQLKQEVGRLVVQTTAAITGKILTTEDQRRLAEETARELTTR